MPVVMVVGRLLHRGGVDDQIVRRIIEHVVGFDQQGLHCLRQVFEHGGRRVLVGRLVALGQDPGLEGEARRVGSESNKILVFRDHPHPALGFLADEVAEYTAFLVDKVLLGSLQFLGHVNRNDGQGDHLRMGVLERSAGSFSVVLENQDVLEAAVFLQIEDAVAKGPEHVFDAFGGERG